MVRCWSKHLPPLQFAGRLPVKLRNIDSTPL